MERKIRKKSGRTPDFSRLSAADRLEVRHTEPAGENGELWPLGYYVFVWKCRQHFRALLVRFMRRRDAEIARRELLAAGLVTMGQINQSDPQYVMHVMCQHLQW